MKNIIRVFVSLNLVALSFLIVYTVSVNGDDSSLGSKVGFENIILANTSNKEDKEATVTFVGDIMLDRFVELRMKEFGEDYPFASTTAIFSGSDAIVINLEGPIMAERMTANAGAMQFSFATSVAPLLKKYGVTHASLANNHTLDKGREVFTFTRAVLNEYDIKTFGDPVLVGTSSVYREKIKNHEFVFVGLNETYGRLSIASSTELVSNIKLENENSIVVVFVHWGEEYKLKHNLTQEKIAHALIDAGADVIIGHHPHVVQDIDIYKEKIIFYSLGNFVFDQYFSSDTKSGLVVRMIVKNDKITYELVPVWAERSNPKIMDGEKREDFIGSLIERSNGKLREAILVQRIETVR